MLNGTEYWMEKKQHKNKIILMWGKTRWDMIRNENIRESWGSIYSRKVENIVENWLRWFDHVERRPIDCVVRRVDQMEDTQILRGRGRPRKTIG